MWVSVARALSPTVRIVVTATTMDEAEELVEAGADRAIATELEAVVGLFDGRVGRCVDRLDVVHARGVGSDGSCDS